MPFSYYVNLVLNWVLFLALFPIAGMWLYRAYRILILKDASVVGLRRGVPAPNPKKFFLIDGLVHLVASLLISYTLYGIIVEAWTYNAWTAMAGVTIWTKIMFSFVIGRHAHPVVKKK